MDAGRAPIRVGERAAVNRARPKERILDRSFDRMRGFAVGWNAPERVDLSVFVA